ncbi:MAG TPA: hypothetical protein VFN44_18900 [Solirubrobacteraceae bacterium]|nr:hypothetical protein [Solirubrobacteraceae bacterium]
MTRKPVTWPRALRAVAVAVTLMLAVLFVGGNFVLVDVRLLGLDIETRLAWVGLAAGALGFLGGRLWAKADQPHRGGDASGSRHDEGADPT